MRGAIMRKDIMFTSQGQQCSGRLYVPDGLVQDQKVPAIVMAHGASGTKDVFLPGFADRFSAAGFVTLSFDYRFFW
jgi:uncharacterized protein